MSDIKADTVVLKWMVGTLAAVTFSIAVPSLWLLLRVAIKTGAIG